MKALLNIIPSFAYKDKLWISGRGSSACKPNSSASDESSLGGRSFNLQVRDGGVGDYPGLYRFCYEGDT